MAGDTDALGGAVYGRAPSSFFLGFLHPHEVRAIGDISPERACIFGRWYWRLASEREKSRQRDTVERRDISKDHPLPRVQKNDRCARQNCREGNRFDTHRGLDGATMPRCASLWSCRLYRGRADRSPTLPRSFARSCRTPCPREPDRCLLNAQESRTRAPEGNDPHLQPRSVRTY